MTFNTERVAKSLSGMASDNGLPVRSDLVLADVQEIDSLKCNILLAYEGTIGAPDMDDLEQFVASRWNKKIVAQTSTASVHEESNAVSVLVTHNTLTRPVSDADAMIRVMAGLYRDASTGNLWVVADNGQNRYLMRRPETAITDIVGPAQRTSRKQASFDSIITAAPLLEVGDTVRFWDGAIPAMGKITSKSGDKVSISSGGKSFSVSPANVFNIVDRGEKQIKKEKGALGDYFSRAFGEEYGKTLTRKLNREDGSLATDSGFSSEKK